MIDDYLIITQAAVASDLIENDKVRTSKLRNAMESFEQSMTEISASGMVQHPYFLPGSELKLQTVQRMFHNVPYGLTVKLSETEETMLKEAWKFIDLWQDTVRIGRDLLPLYPDKLSESVQREVENFIENFDSNQDAFRKACLVMGRLSAKKYATGRLS